MSTKALQRLQCHHTRPASREAEATGGKSKRQSWSSAAGRIGIAATMGSGATTSQSQPSDSRVARRWRWNRAGQGREEAAEPTRMGEGQSSAGKMIQRRPARLLEKRILAEWRWQIYPDQPRPSFIDERARYLTGRGAPRAGGAAYQGACNPAEDPCRPRRGAGDHTTKLMDTRWSTAANEGDPRQEGQQRGAESCSPCAVPEVRLFLLLHPSTKTWTWPAGQEVGHQELWGGDA